MPDVVLRPRRGPGVLTLAPGFASVTDEHGGSRSFPRDGSRGAPGAASRLCARVVDGPPGLALPEIAAVCLLDGRGTVLATVRWDGADHDALESGCAAARMPLDRVPVGRTPVDQVPVGPADVTDGADVASGAGGRTVRLPAPRRPGSARTRRPGRRPVLLLGPREIAVTGAAEPAHWPRLGCAPAGVPAVARLRVTLFADPPVDDPDLLPGPPPGRQRMLGLTLLGAGGRPLAHLPWAGGNLDEVRQACAVAGVQPEYRWRPRVDTAELTRLGVPVLRVECRPAGGRDRRAAPATAGVPADRRLPAAPPGAPRGTGPGGNTRWLYAVTLLVLVGLVVALAVLSGG